MPGWTRSIWKAQAWALSSAAGIFESFYRIDTLRFRCREGAASKRRQIDQLEDIALVRFRRQFRSVQQAVAH